MSNFESEVRSGERFRFGRNWARYCTVLNDDRLHEAERSLREMLALGTLAGKTFLDAGAGSGVFSLAATRLGAKVLSFDYDPDSVNCTRSLKAAHFPDNDRWTIIEGSVLDMDFLRSLGQFDLVYSWGVLHHTGNMWQALDNICAAVEPGGTLYIAIYLDCGLKSRVWKRIKKTYCSGILGRLAVIGTFVPYFAVRGFIEDVFRFKNPVARYRDYKEHRGMSALHDWIDWLGGYPYEYAKPEEVIGFLGQRGFHFVQNRGMEYLFTRSQQGERETNR
jgi:2-polyprenyl-6-hydroxyphenyl methylase/3-demethylubiquinone-9 3-methyltransferase